LISLLIKHLVQINQPVGIEVMVPKSATDYRDLSGKISLSEIEIFERIDLNVEVKLQEKIKMFFLE